MNASLKISPRIMNQLTFGKTLNGKVGAKVKATGNNPNNQAWITILMNKLIDRDGFSQFLNFQVEYIELKADFDEIKDNLDYDLYCVRKEIFYNINSEQELINLINNWLTDVDTLQPVAQINHPAY